MSIAQAEKIFGDLTMLTKLVTVVSQGLMIFGGVVPYIPQYIQIRRSKNADGFSTFVCLTLLVANTLRILFWFGHPFELPLLAQSVIMNVAMMLMVQLCTQVKAQNEIVPSKPKSFTDSSTPGVTSGSSVRESRPEYQNQKQLRRRTFLVKYVIRNSLRKARRQLHKLKHRKKRRYRETLSPSYNPYMRQAPRRRLHDFYFNPQHFWKWTDFSSYIQFMMLFTLLMGAVTVIFLNFPMYVETLGFLAVFFEAMLGAPQFYRNFQNKSTEGMSLGMVMMWTSGDIFKTAYFLIRQAPAQFWICGMMQITLDISILVQVVWYRIQKS